MLSGAVMTARQSPEESEDALRRVMELSREIAIVAEECL